MNFFSDLIIVSNKLISWISQIAARKYLTYNMFAAVVFGELPSDVIKGLFSLFNLLGYMLVGRMLEMSCRFRHPGINPH